MKILPVINKSNFSFKSLSKVDDNAIADAKEEKRFSMERKRSINLTLKLIVGLILACVVYFITKFQIKK